MKIVPSRRFSLDTPLAPSEVVVRLRDAVEPPMFRWTKPERPFTGRVDGATFDIMRSVQGRNSFRPQVRGTIAASGRGARVTGTMQIHPLVLVIMGLVVPTLGVVFASVIVAELQRGSFNPVFLAPIAAIVALPVAMVVTFAREAQRAFGELGQIVQASQGECR
ncbi:MAG TPA: hypothetical protein VFZ21_00925 [Gemmatimonadaceae bacterium]|jgi:hypothetical protein|nr:hypothetical protein [Gemmatimonadaceae bacterium]